MTETERRAGVHAAHCCEMHGCKYGDVDCPVRTGYAVQRYPCECCESDDEDRTYWINRLRAEGWLLIEPSHRGAGV